MRNKSKILEEIVESSAIRSAYNHYLASWRGLTEVENATQAAANLKTINRTINRLNCQMAKEKCTTSAENRHTGKAVPVFHSAAEQNAILHFNNDKRFKINE